MIEETQVERRDFVSAVEIRYFVRFFRLTNEGVCARGGVCTVNREVAAAAVGRGGRF